MGACYNEMVLDGTMTKDGVKAAFREEQLADLHENGHSYSGGFGMASGLVFPPVGPFIDEDTARTYLRNKCQKWEEARAVRYKSGDEERWMIGAWCSS